MIFKTNFQISFNSFWSGDKTFSVSTASFAIFQISVLSQVEVTFIIQLHFTKLVHINTLSSSFFFTGTLSQVRAASLICKLWVSSKTQSAGILSHSAKMIISSGTIFFTSISFSSQSRITLASGWTIHWRASSVFSVLNSWKNQIQAFKIIITKITVASTTSHWKNVIIAATTRIITKVSENCCKSNFHQGFFFLAFNWLNQYSFSFFSASCFVIQL